MSFKAVVNQVGFNLRKASPYIAFGVGLVSMGGAIATAIRSTMKLEPILDNHKEFEDIIKDNYDTEDGKNLTGEEAKKYKKDVRTLYLSTTGQIARLYAPTAALSTLSAASFTFSVGILRGRYLGAVSALEATTAAFEKYRSRVIEDHGEIVDFAYLNDLRVEEREESVIDPETGKKKKIKKQELVGIPHAQFAYRFERYQPDKDIGSHQWEDKAIYSYPYIMNIISCAQARLDSGEIVWLHDLLKELGFAYKVENGSEMFAGWRPGDTITCGLEEDIFLTEEARAYLDNACPDVTLIFNPRPFMFSEIYGNYKFLRDDKVLEVNVNGGEIIDNSLPFTPDETDNAS